MNYEGKKLSECPDGTVAIIDCAGLSVEILLPGNKYASVKIEDGEYVPDCIFDGTPELSTVVQVLKLGKPRPKTFADEEPYVAWKDKDGYLYWRDDFGEMCYCTEDRKPKGDNNGRRVTLAAGRRIPDTYTRAGRVRVVLDPL